MSIRRCASWDTKAYHQFLLDRARVPFEWGTNDCATFAADGIRAITGVDIMAPLRGYTSEVGAMSKISAVTGGKSLEDAVVWCATQQELKEWLQPLLAQRGDLVLYANTDGTLAAGLVHLNGRDIVSPGEKALMRMPTTTVKRAWNY